MRKILVTRVSPLAIAFVMAMAGWADAQLVEPVNQSDDDEAESSHRFDRGAATPDPFVRPADANTIRASARPRDDDFLMPVVFNTPTGYLLPAGVILTEGGADTSGGITSDIRLGLGEVAEVGVTTNALINVRQNGMQVSDALPTYPTALFKMGIGEHLLFRHQPAISIGFRKSFGLEHDDRKSRLAQLYVVASKSVGKKLRVHGGAMFWDVSIERMGEEGAGREVLLHDSGVDKQLRAFGGLEIEPLPRSQILLEMQWVPEFVLGDTATDDRISLRPTLSWGVRYQLADWALIESGVRVPDIKNVDLIDAQIFGQVRFVTRRFRRFLEGLD